jgi:hypothetical protein
MSNDPPRPLVQSSDGRTTLFSPDHFAGTLLRAGAAADPAFQAAATVAGVLHGAGIGSVPTDALRAVAGEFLAAGGSLDPATASRLIVGATLPVQPVLTIFQLSILLDGRPSERSDWAAVRVRYQPSRSLAYFNFAADGRWLVQNAPLFPSAEEPVETTFYFDLGLKPGILARTLNVAASALPTVAAGPPAASSLLPVFQATEIYWTNFLRQPYPPLAAPPPPYTGGPLDHVVFCRRNYPNQPCGLNECAPTAVSNSLQWLNREYHLNIDPGKLTIDFWKDPLGWDAHGGVDHGKWADLKKRFVDDKKNGLPIDSTKESGGHARQVLDQFEGRNRSRTPQAIEVDIGSHVASVTCMGGPDSNGNYHLMAASDTAQNGQTAAGNPANQQIVITANGDVVSGPAWARGKSVNNFVVQCPHPGKFR